jgi:hypothetical protein
MMTILVALVMAMGFVLPSYAWMPLRQAHPANSIEMPSTVMGHQHATRGASSGPSKSSGTCGKFCSICALTCCGVILPAMVLIPLGVTPAHVVFAAEPRLGRGVLASLDPYPPRLTAQS